MRKKIKQILIGVLVGIFSFPIFSFSAKAAELSYYPAGSGTWDTLGITYEYYDSSYRSSDIYYSGGGDFQVCISDLSVTDAHGIVEFWSDDPSGDRFIGWGTFKNNTCIRGDVRPYVDGTNNKAEIYVKVGNVSPGTWATLKFQD